MDKTGKITLSALLIALTCMTVSAGAQAVSKINVAVSPLEGRGLAEGESGTLTDALSSYLANTGTFRVMERGRMDLILKEQGFQQSGACSDAACIVEMGQLLGVDHMVTGSIGKVGQTYSVNLRMISVATGEIIRSLNKYYKGEIDGVLTEIIPIVADELAGKNSAPAAQKLASAPPPVVVTPTPTQPEPVKSVAPTKEERREKNEDKPVEIKKKRRKWPWVLLFLVVAGGVTVAVISEMEESSGTVEVAWPTSN